MVGRTNFVNPERVELKVDILTKKSQNKSFFFTADNYNERVFVLDTEFLLYYAGSIQKRGEEKARIALLDIIAVETVTDKKQPEHGFQVAYEEDGLPFILYIFASSKRQQEEWVQAIRAEALKTGAYFTMHYHPAAWDRRSGFSCCNAPSRGDEGCTLVTKQASETRSRLQSRASSVNPGEIIADMMVKRSLGKSTFFGATNYKERVFVLDSRRLRYYSGNLRKRGEAKGTVELSSVLAVEGVKDGLIEHRKNAFQVIYDEDDEKLMLVVVARSAIMRTQWIKAIREEAQKNNAMFVSTYHPGIWIKTVGKFNCCDAVNKQSLGCTQVTINLVNVISSAMDPNSPDRLMSPRDVKVGKLMKRSLNKSSFYHFKSFKDRVFVLNNTSLRYFGGKVKKRGDEKGCVPLSSILVVAPVDDGALDGHKHAFQVVYNEEDIRYFLYLVAESSEVRDRWINAIAAEVAKVGVTLQDHHHCGVWTKTMGKFSCCSQIAREAQGCATTYYGPVIASPIASPIKRRASSSSSSSSSSD